MCGRLNQFTMLPGLAIAGQALGVSRRKKKNHEGKKGDIHVQNNICHTDYADVLTMKTGEISAERMRFGFVPSWAKSRKAEVAKKFVHNFNARCETVFALASFRVPIPRQRCLIPVRGWHELPERTTPHLGK